MGSTRNRVGCSLWTQAPERPLRGLPLKLGVRRNLVYPMRRNRAPFILAGSRIRRSSTTTGSPMSLRESCDVKIEDLGMRRQETEVRRGPGRWIFIEVQRRTKLCIVSYVYVPLPPRGGQG